MQGDGVWTSVRELPVAMEYLGGVSLNNYILMTGKKFISFTNYFDITGGSNGSGLEYILQFDPDESSWTQVGQLQIARSQHGVSVVNIDDVFHYCQARGPHQVQVNSR